MGNELNGDGLTTATKQEQTDFMTAAMKQIYGPNIDLSSSSQDGQMQNIFIQVVLDVEDIVATAYAARDINQAVGTQLDTLIYWIQRLGGTFTIQPVAVTVSQALTLYGLDQTIQPVFTVADGSGNQYQLVNTQVIGGPGTASYNFQATQPGAVQSNQNTIKVPITIILGVSSINNPATWTTLGINAETDAQFRLRGLSSTSIASQGFYNSLYSVLRNTPGEATTILYENRLGTPSPNASTPVPGIPPHCIWAIVQGVAQPSVIAQDIYNQRSLGCAMKGDQSFDITQDDGSLFTVQWDYVVAENIHIKFTASSIDGINPPNLAAILAQLPVLLQPTIGSVMNINQVQAAVQAIDPNALVTSCGLSTSAGGPFTNTLTPTAANYQFQVLTANIYILELVLLPQTSTLVNTTGTVQFQAYGGTQTFTYSVFDNLSSSTIDSGTGFYTAGPIGGVTDTVQVVDGDGNLATATVVVT